MRMPARLIADSFACIDYEKCAIRTRRAADHIADELPVARRVG